MKKILFVYYLFSLCFFTFSNNKIIYLEPRDGAKLINIENNIIIGFENELAFSPQALTNCIKISGTAGGDYGYSLIKTEGSRKLLLHPERCFKPGEKITLTITGRLAKEISPEVKLKYSFETSLFKPAWDPAESMESELGKDYYYLAHPVFSQMPVLPSLTVTINNNPENGFIFLSNFKLGGQYTPYLIITDKSGLPYSYSQLEAYGMDFKKQPNGNLTYNDGKKGFFLELDNNFNVIDSFYCRNGYRTDNHELRVLSNRHALLMAYDLQVVNMSQIVPGGDTAADVIGLIIQEIDENKNVVFQWRSWDHFQITDALHENLLAHRIDYVHGNAIEVDNDGNLMISSRHMDEITKINRQTGAIIWRWGGRNNQFTFIGDTMKFTYQHAIRRISNGNVTLFDNGNFHSPKFSRAVEYSLNEVTKTAEKVWEFRNNPAIYGPAMGYAQRLPGGNTLITWGTTNPTVTEVKPDGQKAFQMTLPVSMFSYRVYKFDWAGNPTSGKMHTENIPFEFVLKQNFPNPFNPVTNISFGIPKESFTELAVFDITGRELKKIVSKNLKAGMYTFSFDGSSFSSGVYFYRLIAGDFVSSQKMILAK